MSAVLDYTDVDAINHVPTAGTRIGPYRLINQLQQGGMSTVYLGYHIYTRAYFAIKVVDSYIADLGIVAWLGEKPAHQGRVMGTPQYMAPELFQGRVDQRSDVYSVGILLYQILAGRLPFDGPSDWKICLHHLETKPLAPSFYNPSLPRSVERV